MGPLRLYLIPTYELGMFVSTCNIVKRLILSNPLLYASKRISVKDEISLFITPMITPVFIFCISVKFSRFASLRASYTALYVYILVKLFVNYNWSLINHFPLFWIKRCVNRGKITYWYIRAILKNILRMTDTWFSK